MEPYAGVPVFVDVEQQADRFLITPSMCRSIISHPQKVETITTPEGHTFDPPSQCLPTVTSQVETRMSSQVVPTTSNDEPTTIQSEAPNTGQDSTEKSPTVGGGECEGEGEGGGGEAEGGGGEAGALLARAGRRVRCPECRRYTAESEEKMIRHIKKVHKGENPFQCYMCDYSTYNKSLFEEHVRIHQGIKPFKCSQCEYKSASKKNLKKHQLIHRPDNPLRCKQCDFIARHPRALKRHEETHSGADWYKFDSCKFQFQDLTAFKQHERTHKLKCKECDFKTCSRPFLKRHLVKEHGAEENVKKESFNCQICGWTSSTMAKILLHLIHHPKQVVDESVIDVSILRKHGIM